VVSGAVDSSFGQEKRLGSENCVAFPSNSGDGLLAQTRLLANSRIILYFILQIMLNALF